MVTVLLIDGVGRVREMTLHALTPEVLVRIPTPVTVVKNDLNFGPPPLARFQLTDEVSWPRVYRMVTS